MADGSFCSFLTLFQVEKRSPLNAAGIGSAIFAGTAIYNGIKNNYFSKEAVDEYLASLDNEVNRRALLDKDTLNLQV